jgi:hypothetical protein
MKILDATIYKYIGALMIPILYNIGALIAPFIYRHTPTTTSVSGCRRKARFRLAASTNS